MKFHIQGSLVIIKFDHIADHLHVVQVPKLLGLTLWVIVRESSYLTIRVPILSGQLNQKRLIFWIGKEDPAMLECQGCNATSLQDLQCGVILIAVLDSDLGL